MFAEAPSGQTVARCWPLVRDRAGVAAVIEALGSGDLGSMAGFALACADEKGAGVVLRAPGQAPVSSDDGATHWLTAEGLATWAEFRLGTATTAVTIGVGGDLATDSLEPVSYSLVGGTVVAGSVTLYLGPGAAESAEHAAAEPVPTPPTAPTETAQLAGVSVQAVACPYGHLGPPYDPYCRICGTAIEDPRAFVAERPPLGLLRLSTGDVVPLDRGVILGRNPRATDEHAADRPHLVRLPSPDNDVSRTHVEVRLQDWHVLVLDLGSTNGTTVTNPGRPPIRLRAHEPVPLEPNAEVNLADEIVFRYEVPTG